VVDLPTGRVVYGAKDLQDVVHLAWEGETSLQVSTRPYDSQIVTEYRLGLGERPLTLKQVSSGPE
jgi:hypothetical protein